MSNSIKMSGVKWHGKCSFHKGKRTLHFQPVSPVRVSDYITAGGVKVRIAQKSSRLIGSWGDIRKNHPVGVGRSRV